MKVASESAMVPIASVAPLSGGGADGAPPGAPPVTGLSAFSAATRMSLRRLVASACAAARGEQQRAVGEQRVSGIRMLSRHVRCDARTGVRVGGDDRLNARIGEFITRAEDVGGPGTCAAGELRQALAITAVLHIDVGLHGQANLQRMGGELTWVEAHAHRHTLH